MEAAQTQYRSLKPRENPQLPRRVSAENRYWKRFRTTLLEPQLGAVSAVHSSNGN